MDIVLFGNAYGKVRFKAEPDWARQLIDRHLTPEAHADMPAIKERLLTMLVERIELLGFDVDERNLALLKTLSGIECEKLLLKICYAPKQERNLDAIEYAMLLLMREVFG